jgi:hypothetical protein
MAALFSCLGMGQSGTMTVMPFEPRRFGGQADALVEELRALMQKLKPTGTFTEIVATKALLATRE